MNNQPTPTIKGRTSLIVFLLIVALLFTVYIATTSTEMRNKELIDKSAKAVEDFNAEQAKKEQETKDENQAIMRNQQVFNRQSWDTFAKDVENFTKIHIQLKELSSGCSLLSEQLLTGPEGLFLTEDSPEQRTFVGLKLTLEDAAIKVEQWELLVAAASEQVTNMFSLNSISTPVERSTRESFEEAYTDARRLHTELKAAKLFLDGLMQQGKESLNNLPQSEVAILKSTTPGAVPPTAENLAELLEQKEADQTARIARERQELILKLRADAEAELRSSLVDKEKEKLMLEAEIERTRLDQEISELRVQAAKAAADKVAAAKDAERKQKEHEEDLALAEDLPRVKSLLSPFIARTKSRIDQQMRITYVEEEAPLSLSLLEGIGALREGRDGVAALYKAAGFAQDSGRPLGGYVLGLVVSKENFEAQQLLRKHAQAMVRAGLLLE